MEATKTKNDLLNYYYVQAFSSGTEYKMGTTICFAAKKKEADEKARAWANKNGLDGSIHLYHNNYKLKARKMVAEGNFI